LAFQPFHSELTTTRTVRIPSELTEEKRAALVKQIEDAVARQAALVKSCDAILQPVGQPREQEGVLLIEHEPATPFDLDAILSADPRPDASMLWWITWSALRALAASEAKRVIHGGLQLRSFFVDRIGRVKLTDFGLASAVEVVCGGESRRHLVCDDPSDEDRAERKLSGSWAKLDENAHRENSWLAPRFAPEILAGGTRLNLTSDQFSLGVALYELATGVHPLGAELSDPELFGYFVPEPYPLEDERTDWADAFKRQSREAAMSGDQPVLKWAALVYRLLANDPSERFPNFTAALEAAREHVPAEWPEALHVLGEALELLAHEQYDPFLMSLGPWSENPTLPEPWRARLAECIGAVEKLKATQAARKAVEARLEEGYAALDHEQLEQARAIAAEVVGSIAEDDALRERAVELERLCAEHEQLIRAKADELTRANLQSAREALERGEFPEARMIVTGVLEDPLTNAAFAQQAEELLHEIDEQAERFAQQHDELETARREHGEGKLTAALERLDRLLADDQLVDSLRPAVETFARELETERRRHEEHLATIAEVEAALGRADLAAAEETLAMLPFDTRDLLIIDRRDTLTKACEHLRQLLERRDAAEEQLRQGEAQGALDGVSGLLEEELSPALREQLTELAERCQQVVEQIRKSQVSDALEALALAETAYQTDNLKKCRHQLSMVVPLANRLDERDQQRVRELDASAIRYEAATKRMEAAERRTSQREFDAALAELSAIEMQGLPDAALERIATLRAEVDRAREADRQQRARELREQLEQVARHLARGEVDRAEALLTKVEVAPDTAPELSERYERLRQESVEGQRVAESLAAVEGALRGDHADEAARQLDELDAGKPLPDWAVTRIGQLRERVAEVEETKRARTIEQARTELDAVTSALETADHATAVEHLAAAQTGVNLAAELRPRYQELERAAADLKAWLPKLSGVEQALKQERLAEAYQDAVALLKQTPIPAPVEQRLRAVESLSHKKIGSHRDDLTTRLQAIESELERRGRRIRSFTQRVEAVKTDPLATQEHQDTATELVRRFEALPQPRRFPVPIAIAAAVVATAAGVGWYLLRGPAASSDDGGTHVVTPDHGSDQTETSADAREQIAVALRRIQQTYDQAVEREVLAGRTPPNWHVYFAPDDAFETTLLARIGSEEPLTLAPNVTEAEIARLDLTEEMLRRLLPSPPDAGPQIAGALERVRETYQRWVAELPAGQTAPRWEFRFEPADGFETTLYARDEAGRDTAVASGVTAEDIEQFNLTDDMRDLLLRMEPPWPAELAAGTLTEPGVDPLSTLLTSLAPPEALVRANPPLPVLAQILERVEVGARSGENSVTLQMVLKDEAGSISGRFTLEAGTDRWQPAAENAAALSGLFAGLLTGLEGHVSAVAESIQQYYVDGKLVAAYRAYEHVQVLAGAFEMHELAEPVARLETAVRRLPPRWRNPGEYEESAERDDDLDYPRVLTRDSRSLVLVNVPPNDPLWDEISAADQARPSTPESVGYTLAQAARRPPDERHWYIFYIEAAESTETVDGRAGSVAQQQTGRDLPSTDEWLLAALKLRGRSDISGFFGGLWEWCLKGTEPWVCGGCDAIHAKYMPWPKEPAGLAEVWAWLNSALVSQPRQRGDGLAGVRTVAQPG
jgi:hypothetical protein